MPYSKQKAKEYHKAYYLKKKGKNPDPKIVPTPNPKPTLITPSPPTHTSKAAQYNKKWREKNPDKVKALSKASYLKRKEKDPDRVKALNKEAYERWKQKRNGTLNPNAETLNPNSGTLNPNAETLNPNSETLNPNAETLTSKP